MSLEFNLQNELCLGGTSLVNLVNQREDAFYVYSLAKLAERVTLFRDSFKSFPQLKIHYAVKANAHEKVISLMKSLGLGADVVSFGEVQKAIKGGMLATDIIYSGVGKTVREIDQALQLGICQFNVESVNEIKRIIERAEALGKNPEIAIRINPEVDAKTHPYISTGFRDNKFGVDLQNLPECLSLLKSQNRVTLKGLSVHIGSQIQEVSSLQEAMQKLKKVFFEVREQGFALTTLDVGGGLGINYTGSEAQDLALLAQYSKMIQEEFHDFKFNLQMEPGRFLVARCGLLLVQVQYIKKTPFKTFVIVNAGMNYLIRPALYKAHHQILALKKRDGGATMVADVVGPICESSDFLGAAREFTGLEEGDWLAVCDSGAYGASMASQYNAFPLPEEVFV